MYMSLSPGTIGVQTDLETAIDLAKRHNFTGLDFSMTEATDLADERGASNVRALFDEAGVRMGNWSFPVDFRKDEATWREGLDALPRLAKTAQDMGALRCATYILPGNDERDFSQNFAFHAERLTPAAKILADHGIMFGLEWVGTKTLRDGFKHPFIHTIDGMLELCHAIGTSNMGLLVDIFHIYTSLGTFDDVRKLRKEQVVYVHVNDAVTDTAAEEQIDNIRDLPGYTGVLDLTGFLHALRDIGYDGPVTAEPFVQRLRELPDEEAVAETSAAMHKVWKTAGLN
ncbi:sugar phosphate isomerase/epimerase [Chloroflexi bacterium TSY]|nr:sugar phosphate isomerase/epimerase [Chloroflexi bacterium TSY]